LVTVVAYIGGLMLKQRLTILILFIFIIIGILAFFKYSQQLLLVFPGSTLLRNITLPIGISFFSFQAISYLIDVFREKINPERDYIVFSLYLSFFPIILSGPIERAENLIPQLRTLNSKPIKPIINSMKLILFGLFCKVVVANKLNMIVQPVFADISVQPGGNILIATFIFSIQIFLDFYSYCIIALGLSEILGIKVTNNFNHPYFSNSFRDFWQRWNITLFKWFKDYIYIPLGGNRSGTIKLNINVLVIFTISGLWHGASITFILWGVYLGLIYIAEAFNRRNLKIRLPIILSRIILITLLLFGWLLFKVTRIEDLVLAFTNLINFRSQYFDFELINIYGFFFFIILGLLTIFFDRYLLDYIITLRPNNIYNAAIDLIYFNFILLLLIIFWDLGKSPFIYFNF
jgi:D-alanyl-lipoteichoic acid acyltransferase DltB (MBOAT superfamily)